MTHATERAVVEDALRILGERQTTLGPAPG